MLYKRRVRKKPFIRDFIFRDRRSLNFLKNSGNLVFYPNTYEPLVLQSVFKELHQSLWLTTRVVVGSNEFIPLYWLSGSSWISQMWAHLLMRYKSAGFRRYFIQSIYPERSFSFLKRVSCISQELATLSVINSRIVFGWYTLSSAWGLMLQSMTGFLDRGLRSVLLVALSNVGYNSRSVPIFSRQHYQDLSLEKACATLLNFCKDLLTSAGDQRLHFPLADINSKGHLKSQFNIYRSLVGKLSYIKRNNIRALEHVKRSLNLYYNKARVPRFVRRTPRRILRWKIYQLRKSWFSEYGSPLWEGVIKRPMQRRSKYIRPKTKGILDGYLKRTRKGLRYMRAAKLQTNRTSSVVRVKTLIKPVVRRSIRRRKMIRNKKLAYSQRRNMRRSGRYGKKPYWMIKLERKKKAREIRATIGMEDVLFKGVARSLRVSFEYVCWYLALFSGEVEMWDYSELTAGFEAISELMGRIRHIHRFGFSSIFRHSRDVRFGKYMNQGRWSVYRVSKLGPRKKLVQIYEVLSLIMQAREADQWATAYLRWISYWFRQHARNETVDLSVRLAVVRLYRWFVRVRDSIFKYTSMLSSLTWNNYQFRRWVQSLNSTAYMVFERQNLLANPYLKRYYIMLRSSLHNSHRILWRSIRFSSPRRKSNISNNMGQIIKRGLINDIKKVSHEVTNLLPVHPLYTGISIWTNILSLGKVGLADTKQCLMSLSFIKACLFNNYLRMGSTNYDVLLAIYYMAEHVNRISPQEADDS